MAQELAQRGRTALVFRGSDGLDELTTTGPSQIWAVWGGQVLEFELNPTDLGLKTAKLADLVGGDAHFNAQVARQLFAGDQSGQLAAIREIVALNAAAGLVAYQLAKRGSELFSESGLKHEFQDALTHAFSAIDSGDAGRKLSAWMAATQA